MKNENDDKNDIVMNVPLPPGGEMDFNSPDFDLHAQSVERTARNMLNFYEAEKQRQSLDAVVFSLERSMAETQMNNPVDFSDMLTTNARILNAAFEYYLDKAHQSPAADGKIGLAMKMQTQLARTIDVWRRLADFQNRVTK